VKLHNLAIVAAILFIGCGKSEQSRTPVARIDSETLTLEEIAARFDSTRAVSDAQIHAYVQRWITDELLYREALRRGLDQRPHIAAQLEDIRRQLVINALLEEEVYSGKPEEISERDVRQYYDDHRNEFILTNDVVLVSFVLFGDRETANAFRLSILRGTPWSQALQVLRRDPAQRGTILAVIDSAYFTQQTLVPVELWRAAMGIGIQNPSFPIRTDEGFYVLMVWKLARQGQIAELPYVESDIRSRLTIERRRKRYDALLENLRARHAVEVLVAPGVPDTSKHQGE
jgi:peptidyl-prolyl cis-trans isomerase C